MRKIRWVKVVAYPLAGLFQFAVLPLPFAIPLALMLFLIAGLWLEPAIAGVESMTKRLLLASVMLLFPQSDNMMTPKVEKKTETTTQQYTTITRTCPEGYEGHYVVMSDGFGAASIPGMNFYSGSGEQFYTICFKKDFMDKVRKDPDLVEARPIMRGA